MQNSPFSGVSTTPEGHFKLYFYSAILHVIDHMVQLFGSQDVACERFPFLAGYVKELAQIGLDGLSMAQVVALVA